jgi:hypothetical protein
LKERELPGKLSHHRPGDHHHTFHRHHHSLQRNLAEQSREAEMEALAVLVKPGLERHLLLPWKV